MAPSNGTAAHKRKLHTAITLGMGLVAVLSVLIIPLFGSDSDQGPLAPNSFDALLSPRSAARAAADSPEPTLRLDSTDKITLQKKRSGTTVGIPRPLSAHTLELEGTTFVLFGIYVPVPEATCTVTGQPFACGQMAQAAFEELLAAHTLVACTSKGRDPLGRTVGVCYTGVTDLGGEMLRSGWALANERLNRSYGVVERSAKAAKRGIWAGTFETGQFIGY